ncbi:hypothetical protein [Fodinibius sp.]|uniref:hypothetical protein n=1 Tax=Fodinibius sp. TaxID=1872440 RepID=UPI002ACE6CE4|nr:hypothetical protein [Fodinibius sp.]MDZ7658090.1 hypothetical protein [Fodinibius sp.]
MDQDYSIDLSSIKQKFKDLDASIEKKAEMLAEKVARDIIKHARSLTSETKPGVNPGDGPRKKHPGNWADVRGQLANSIKQKVLVKGFVVSAIVEATAEYAEALDDKTGYDVLGGAETIARKALRKYQHLILE